MYLSKNDHRTPNNNSTHFSLIYDFFCSLWSTISSFFGNVFLLYISKKNFWSFLSLSFENFMENKYFETFFISFLFVLIFLGYWPLFCTLIYNVVVIFLFLDFFLFLFDKFHQHHYEPR